MIRLMLISVFLILFLIVSIPLMFVEWMIKKFNPYAADISSLRTVQWAFKVILSIAGTKVTAIGEENIPKDQAVLYVPNHQSYFDILIIYSKCPGLTGFVAKDGMEKIPLLSIWMKRLYCLFLNRDNLKEGLKTILIGINQIKNGISMCIFPEGTRNISPELGMMPFKEGSLKMAEKTGCPIIPIAISNTNEIFEKQMPRIKKSHVIIQYGQPIIIANLEKEQKKFIGKFTHQQIECMLQTHAALLSEKQ